MIPSILIPQIRLDLDSRIDYKQLIDFIGLAVHDSIVEFFKAWETDIEGVFLHDGELVADGEPFGAEVAFDLLSGWDYDSGHYWKGWLWNLTVFLIKEYLFYH